MMPRVSAILPTRDRAPILRRTIDSVVSQSLREWELIVVDDGSTKEKTPPVFHHGDAELLDPHHRAVARGLAPTRHAAFARGVLLDLIRSGRGRPADLLWLAVTFGGRPLYDALRLFRAFWRRVL